MGTGHRPVMLAEVLSALDQGPSGLYVDGTVGAGGHAAAILKASAPSGQLLGLDRDPRALDIAHRHLQPFRDRVRLMEATFDQMTNQLQAWGRGAANGVLLDLGVSSMQLDQRERGFSFQHDAALDMRMSGQGLSASDILADSSENELARLFARLGEEPLARRIARALVAARAKEPITSTGRLAELITQAMPAAVRRKRKTHPATKVFQALRLAVNDELGMLERFLERAPSCLAPGGRLAILSYHSLEDRQVKRAIKKWSDPCTCPTEIAVCLCGKKPLFKPLGKLQRPSEQEVMDNPRARSARLRVAQRTEASL